MQSSTTHVYTSVRHVAAQYTRLRRDELQCFDLETRSRTTKTAAEAGM